MKPEELLEERGKIYGDVRDNMNCAYELTQVLKRYNRPIRIDYNSIGHMGCLDMIMHKLARIMTGKEIHLDNYDDICGYAKLARNIAEQQKKENKNGF